MTKPWHPKTPEQVARDRAEEEAEARRSFVESLSRALALRVERETILAGRDYSDWHKEQAAAIGISKKRSEPRTCLEELAHDIADLLDNVIKEAADPEHAAQDARELGVREPEDAASD